MPATERLAVAVTSEVVGSSEVVMPSPTRDGEQMFRPPAAGAYCPTSMMPGRVSAQMTKMSNAMISRAHAG